LVFIEGAWPGCERGLSKKRETFAEGEGGNKLGEGKRGGCAAGGTGKKRRTSYLLEGGEKE